MRHDADILIVGGGLNGPALALALAQGGLRVTLIDAAPEAAGLPDFDGRAYSLAVASRRLLGAIGVWPALAGAAQPIEQIKASDGRAGEGAAPWFLHFDHDEIEEGPMGHMVEDRHLRAAFRDAIAATEAITHLPGTRVVAQEITDEAARVTLQTGAQLSARLVVGCDGRDSATAARAGIARVGWPYAQTGLVCAVEHAKPHDAIAHQFFMPAGPLAILPLTGRRSSIVWTETHANAAAIHALDNDAYLAALRPRFGDFLGPLRLIGARGIFPLGLSLAQRYVAPRLALVGDAAHGVHPVAGQGLNLGLRDVGALAEVLIEAARRGEDLADLAVLERYQRWRRFDTTTLALGMDAVNRLFSNDNPLLRLGRDLGMGVVSATPALRRRFIREAAGLTGTLPKLLQGRPL